MPPTVALPWQDRRWGICFPPRQKRRPRPLGVSLEFLAYRAQQVCFGAAILRETSEPSMHRHGAVPEGKGPNSCRW
jgi:hypothetical protein